MAKKAKDFSIVFSVFLGLIFSNGFNPIFGQEDSDEPKNMEINLTDGVAITQSNMDNTKMPPPLKQMKSGKNPMDVQCRDGFDLIFKPGKTEAACVFPNSVEPLILRGWAQ